MCCILKDKGKKKKRKKGWFLGWSHVPFFKMWLIFLWNDLNRKKKCENLKKKKESEREEEQRTRGEGQRPKAQTREEDKSSTGREERMSLKRSERDRYKYKRKEGISEETKDVGDKTEEDWRINHSEDMNAAKAKAQKLRTIHKHWWTSWGRCVCRRQHLKRFQPQRD